MAIRLTQTAILEEHYPAWREARAELNELPLTAEVWKEWAMVAAINQVSFL